MNNELKKATGARFSRESAMAPDAEEAITGARTEKNDRDSGDEVRERKKRVLVSAMKLNRTESSPFDESYTALLPNPSLPVRKRQKPFQ